MKTNQWPIYFMITILAVLLMYGCALPGRHNNDPLDGTSWEVLYYRKSSPISGTEMDISFQDGSFRGSAGCNSYGGTYQVAGNSITMSDINSTEMYCVEPEGVMEQEGYFLASLQVAVRFEIEGDRLIIHRPGQDTLTFRREQ